MIRLNIEVETDFDFTLDFLCPKNALEYTIKKFEGGYKMKIDFYQNEDTISDYILTFLESFKIDSTKEWHEKDLKEGIERYKNILKEEGLTSCGDILGGNWKFLIRLDRITKEYFI